MFFNYCIKLFNENRIDLLSDLIEKCLNKLITIKNKNNISKSTLKKITAELNKLGKITLSINLLDSYGLSNEAYEILASRGRGEEIVQKFSKEQDATKELIIKIISLWTLLDFILPLMEIWQNRL